MLILMSLLVLGKPRILSLKLSFHLNLGLIWAEIKSLWNDGLIEYITDLWNIVDFITNVFFTAWILLRATAWFVVQVALVNRRGLYAAIFSLTSLS